MMLREKLYPRLLIISVVLALVGVVNATYLAYTSFAGISPLCTIISGCDLVAASPYSRVFGVPLSLFGVFFYLLLAGFSLWGIINPLKKVSLYLVGATTLGFLLSLYFLYLQAFIIKAFCQYCLLSLFDATVLFILALCVWWLDHKTKKALPHSEPSL
ncbi:MAG: vitamin K epoxide reductase family protein [Patescibacteria group bacterium]